jgi:type IV pilus assembly protein PilB
MRDSETAEIAMRAAITGHLVLSTIHTNDAVSSILRLTNMGIPGYLVAASLVGIISQRLVRRICTNCKVAQTPTVHELQMASISPMDAMDINFQRGEGCSSCDHLGYKGRMAVHEVLIVDQGIRAHIHAGSSVAEMQKHAQSMGMKTIKESAFDLINQGHTTLEEMIAIMHGSD